MADIVSVPAGNFTPGALAALQNTAALINASWGQANLKTTAFETKIDAVETWLSGAGLIADIAVADAAVPTVLEPTVAIPATLSTTDVMSLFDTKYLELVALLSTKFTDFRTTYFPDESAAYTAAEDWLQGALANPSVGLPAAVAAQLLEEDRSRVLAEVARASDAVLSTFAARRFPLPPGAAAGAVLQIQQKGQDDLAASSRKITGLSVEMMKFAVEKTLGMRQIALNSAVEYIKALASGPEMASQLVGIGYDAQSKLISSASSFYSARTDAAKLVSQVQQFNVTAKLQADEKNQAVDIELVEDRLKALLSESNALAQMAASMFNNLHASAGTSYAVNGT